jgi:6,7-dimethyl-8-ribityllumazine synthase
MPNILEGDLLARDAKIAFVVSRFNEFITDRLLDGALDTLTRHGGDAGKAAVVYVPGAFEIPVTAKRLAASGKFDAIVCLGAVIKGATAHFDYVAGEAAAGIARVSTETGVPVIFGVITVDTIEQAIERAGSKQGNTGSKATLAAIEMINLFKKF